MEKYTHTYTIGNVMVIEEYTNITDLQNGCFNFNYFLERLQTTDVMMDIKLIKMGTDGIVEVHVDEDTCTDSMLTIACGISDHEDHIRYACDEMTGDVMIFGKLD